MYTGIRISHLRLTKLNPHKVHHQLWHRKAAHTSFGHVSELNLVSPGFRVVSLLQDDITMHKITVTYEGLSYVNQLGISRS